MRADKAGKLIPAAMMETNANKRHPSKVNFAPDADTLYDPPEEVEDGGSFEDDIRHCSMGLSERGKSYHNLHERSRVDSFVK